MSAISTIFNLFFTAETSCGCGRTICKTKIATITTIFSAFVAYIYHGYAVIFNKEPISDSLSPLIPYKPFALNLIQTEKFNMVQSITKKIMIGDNQQNNIMIAHDTGSSIWAKNGSNFIIANQGNDIFYFSLCTTKIINKTVSVIKDFDFQSDTIKVFCSQHIIQPKDILIRHETYLDHNLTYVEVHGEIDYTAVCLLGNINIHNSDININELSTVESELTN